MANEWYSPPSQYNSSGTANTTQLGYSQGGGGVAWDPSYQPGGANSKTTLNTGAAAPGGIPLWAQGATSFNGQSLGVPGGSPPAGGSSTFQASGTSGTGGVAQNPGTGYTLQQLVQMQMQQNNQARSQNQGEFNDASGFLKQYTTPLNAQVIQQMKNTNNMQAQAGESNAFREQQGLMGAGGQTDASSLAAASAQANRNALGAQIGANTNLGIQAAQINNTAGYNVGNSIMSHLPQYKPDDYSGLMGLTSSIQNQNTLNTLSQNNFNTLNQQNQQNLNLQNQIAQNTATRPIQPTAGRIIGPNDNNQSRGGSGANTNNPAGGGAVTNNYYSQPPQNNRQQLQMTNDD